VGRSAARSGNSSGWGGGRYGYKKEIAEEVQQGHEVRQATSIRNRSDFHRRIRKGKPTYSVRRSDWA